MSTKPGRWVPPLSSLLSIGTLVSLYSSTMRWLDRAGMQWVLSNTEEAEVQTHYLSIVVCVKSYLQFLNMGEGREGNLSMGFEVIGDVHISHSFFKKHICLPLSPSLLPLTCIYVEVCVYAHTHIYADVCVHVCIVCRGQRTILGIIPQLPTFWVMASLKVTKWVRMTGQ